VKRRFIISFILLLARRHAITRTAKNQRFTCEKRANQRTGLSLTLPLPHILRGNCANAHQKSRIQMTSDRAFICKMARVVEVRAPALHLGRLMTGIHVRDDVAHTASTVAVEHAAMRPRARASGRTRGGHSLTRRKVAHGRQERAGTRRVLPGLAHLPVLLLEWHVCVRHPHARVVVRSRPQPASGPAPRLVQLVLRRRRAKGGARVRGGERGCAPPEPGGRRAQAVACLRPFSAMPQVGVQLRSRARGWVQTCFHSWSAISRSFAW
jgi:hypothetical protein